MSIPCSRAWSSKLRRYSNPTQAQKKATQVLGYQARLCVATNPSKKYRVQNPKTGHWTQFGQMGYEDYTRHRDKRRRRNYLTRSAKIRGHWKADPYSANNLSRKILW
jgi:hypothetical protein